MARRCRRSGSRSAFGLNVRTPPLDEPRRDSPTDAADSMRSCASFRRCDAPRRATGHLTEDELARWAARDVARGRPVSTPSRARVDGVAPAGELLVRSDDGSVARHRTRLPHLRRATRMLLIFDVGNTETTIGLFDGAELRAHWRIMTDVARTPDEFGVLLRGLLAGRRSRSPDVTGVAIGSVVPRVTAPLAEACREWLPATRVEIIDARSPLPITLARRRAAHRRRRPHHQHARGEPDVRARCDRRRPGHGDDVRLHHGGRGLPRRRDRAGCAQLGRDAVPSHVQAPGDGARRAAAA